MTIKMSFYIIHIISKKTICQILVSFIFRHFRAKYIHEVRINIDWKYLFTLQSLEWRKYWNADNLSEWDSPQILKDYMTHGSSGFDKDGAPSKSFIYEFR